MSSASPSPVPTPRADGSEPLGEEHGCLPSVSALAPGVVRPDVVSARVRDRVLLYTRGMDVEPLASVEFALKSLRRAGSRAGSRGSAAEADPAAAMAELHALLRENHIDLHLTDADGQLLRSAPPMNRRRMVAEEMDRIPLLTSLKRFIRKLRGLPEKGRKS